MKLELFYYDSCPFCQYVLNAIDDLGININYCNIQESTEHLNRLVNDTGRRTVPCLYIDNKPMFESSDIVEWLQENQSKIDKKA